MEIHVVGHVVALLAVGLVVGVIARLTLPRRQSLPIGMTMLVGAGSMVLTGLVAPGLVGFFLGVVVAVVIISLTTGAAGQSPSRAR